MPTIVMGYCSDKSNDYIIIKYCLSTRYTNLIKNPLPGDKVLLITTTEKTLYIINYKTKEIPADNFPHYGNLMELQNFIEYCNGGSFIDYDGFGYYATNSKMTDIIVRPSDITNEDINRNFSHVVWFNK